MAGQHTPHPQLTRTNDHQWTLHNPQGIPVSLFANEEVPIERAGIEQLLGFLQLQESVEALTEAQHSGRIAPFWGEDEGALERVILTPDFHKGGGIPVGTVAQTKGFVIPQAVGNDICCGMRLLQTNLTQEQIEPVLPALKKALRSIYFEGQRALPMSPRQREALLKEGLWGLLETASDTAGRGLWRRYDPAQQELDLERVHLQGVLPAKGCFAFGDYIKAAGEGISYDSQIGSIGGGNHFVELQVVEALMDGTRAHQWGITPGSVMLMIHSGSVGLGHLVGGAFRDRARALYPKELKRPTHHFPFLPTTGPHAHIAAQYLDAMANAANFAFGNRLWLGLMAVEALTRTLGEEVSASLVYDAPHNLIWADEPAPGHYIHRKGACPAYGMDVEQQGPFQYTGQPVIIPGSMGAASFLFAGQGHQEALSSACHGAGRSLSRGKARQIDEAHYQETIAPLHIVTPIDPDDPKYWGRQDILDKYHQHLKEEGPLAYKPVTSVIETVQQAGIAHPVAQLKPILTVKG